LEKLDTNSLTMFEGVGYDLALNGYSLIPSWWRDRPYETQQPANEKTDSVESSYFGQRC
jgi:hypothetical protein